MKSAVGVSFGAFHSFTDLGLKLKEISIGLPEQKTEEIDVPGMNGTLDLTEALHGGIRYNNRTIKFVFDARDCSYYDWPRLISRVANAVQGTKKQIILDIDKAYYYTGRCSLDTKKSNEVRAEITVSCDCFPYKMLLLSSEEDWLWDPFSFVNSVIRSYHDIKIDSVSDYQEVVVVGSAYNDELTITTDADMTVKFEDTDYALIAGDNIMYSIPLAEGSNSLYFKGSGNVAIKFRGGTI